MCRGGFLLLCTCVISYVGAVRLILVVFAAVVRRCPDWWFGGGFLPRVLGIGGTGKGAVGVPAGIIDAARVKKAERSADDDIDTDQRFEMLDCQTRRAWPRSMEQKLSELDTFSEEHRHLNGHELLSKIREKLTRIAPQSHRYQSISTQALIMGRTGSLDYLAIPTQSTMFAR